MCLPHEAEQNISVAHLSIHLGNLLQTQSSTQKKGINTVFRALFHFQHSISLPLHVCKHIYPGNTFYLNECIYLAQRYCYLTIYYFSRLLVP